MMKKDLLASGAYISLSPNSGSAASQLCDLSFPSSEEDNACKPPRLVPGNSRWSLNLYAYLFLPWNSCFHPLYSLFFVTAHSNYSLLFSLPHFLLHCGLLDLFY